MRLRFAQLRSFKAAQVLAAGILFSGLAALGCVRLVRAQNPDTLMPEQSAAKGKQILQQLIDGLGGPT